MIEEVIYNINEKIDFKKKDEFLQLLQKCIHYFNRAEDADRESARKYRSIVFKLDVFFKEFTPFQTELGKDKIYTAGVKALFAICEELLIELDEKDLFLLFHLRDLGKFRIREDKLLKEVQSLWTLPQYKQFTIDNKQDFAASMRALRDSDAINYRRGNMTLNQTIIVRYR